MGVVIQSLRDSARGERCTARIRGVCNENPETTVLCHIRDLYAGFGTKANDWSSFYACSDCHEHLDQHAFNHSAEVTIKLRAMQRTQERFYERGLMTFPQDPQPPAKPLNKIVPRPAKFRR
jgi:hypothetical protein